MEEENREREGRGDNVRGREGEREDEWREEGERERAEKK